MSTLSSEQLLDLAGKFRNMANETSNMLVENWDNLSMDQRRHLENTEMKLRIKANELLGQSTIIHFDNLNESINDINKATEKLNKAIQQIQNVEDIISYATLAVKLGGAISTGNFGAIAAVSAEIVNEYTET